ncbi:MAG: ferritin-like domain-containing protein [Candidatus Scalinduaceae bacterium]
MNLSEAMEMVIKDEKELQEKYVKLAEQQTDPLLKTFFKRIVKDALNHEKKLHKKYERLLSTLKKKTF